MSLFIWNTQGAAALKFMSILKSFIQEHKPQVLVLVEPKISGVQADRIISKIGYQRSHRIEATGFSGGIWLLWSENIELEILYSHHQFIHTLVKWPEVGKYTHFTAVYGSPTPSTKEHLWNDLSMLASNTSNAWFVAGDFNATLSSNERQGGIASHHKGNRSFINFVNRCHLLDLGFSGPKFTWRRGTLLARLDRALSNARWCSVFPNACVYHLPKLGSDHRPILVNLGITSHPHSIT